MLPHLRVHLTAHADDNHAAPVLFVLIVELSHVIHRLCEAPSIPLSFSLAAVLPRRDT